MSQDPITKPMLASPSEDHSTLQFPLLATQKLDGIRCLIIEKDGRKQAVSRNFKPIQNHFIRTTLEAYCPVGFDGELMLRKEGATFQEITSAVMGRDGTPDFEYYVFDYVAGPLTRPYSQRVRDLENHDTCAAARVRKILPVGVRDIGTLVQLEENWVRMGFEGVMVRTPESPYKCGRSSVKEGYLLKIKRFEDSEATILGFIEKMHNGNEAQKDAFGRTKRSTAKAGKTPLGTLGALAVRDVKTDVEFELGTGYDEADRLTLWQNRNDLLGKTVKYKFQPSGVKEKPRFPVFLGLRSAADMDAAD